MDYLDEDHTRPEIKTRGRVAKVFRVGAYIADYSDVTEAELAASDPELEKLYRNAKPVEKVRSD